MKQSPTSLPGPTDNMMVTSSDLVRHFGIWQERAARAPVYILHRGRPRFVLTSVDVMDALCAPHSSAPSGSVDVDLLLDGMRDLVVLTDAELRIIAVSRAARRHFGDMATEGLAAERLAAEVARPLLSAILHRVRASGVIETIELPSPRTAGRRLTITIQPHRDGIALFIADATVTEELRDVRALHQAISTSFGVLPGVGSAWINLRGYIERPDASLASVSGLSIEILATLRFVTLIDISRRVAVADALEVVITQGRPQTVEAMLLGNGGSLRPVQIGLAPLRLGGPVEAVIATLVVRD